MNYLIIITGPTAVGKTTAAIETARHFKTEIVSADSRQIFRELSVGTAVPSPAEQTAVKHHFIQTHSIFENYNASRYESEAIELLGQLFKKNNIIVLTGGSMLYIDAVCKGIDDIPDIDPELRRHLMLQLEERGIENLRLQLKKTDPEYYSQVDLKNPARIVHALEVCMMTGKTYSSFRRSTPRQRNFTVIKTALNCERTELHRRINNRVDGMMGKGLEKEAQDLFPYRHLNSLNTVGYRELFDYFEGKTSKDKAVELIKRNTRRYARKQITWFRNDSGITWFESGETKNVIRFIESSVQQQ